MSACVDEGSRNALLGPQAVQALIGAQMAHNRPVTANEILARMWPRAWSSARDLNRTLDAVMASGETHQGVRLHKRMDRRNVYTWCAVYQSRPAALLSPALTQRIAPYVGGPLGASVTEVLERVVFAALDAYDGSHAKT